MNKSILVGKNILYSRLEKMIELAENDSTSKRTIARMKEQRNNIHHALQDKDNRIKELEKSDTSKEQSSIDYYNEMRKYKAQINAIREIVEQGSKTHHSYAIKNLLKEWKQ